MFSDHSFLSRRRMLVYNLSPSFNWSAHGFTQEKMKSFVWDIAQEGCVSIILVGPDQQLDSFYKSSPSRDFIVVDQACVREFFS